MTGHNEEIASYIPTTDPIIAYSKTGSVHIQYSDIPRPYQSWIWVENELGGHWDAPTKCPIDGKAYIWDESLLNWIEINK
jgi:hypothetical protein